MKRLIAVLLVLVAISVLAGCGQPVQSVSGIKMKTIGKVKTNAKGDTVEQQNIKDRIAMDNQPGSIKHLYVISAYSGQVILYSTVRGKVTSSNKRLTPAQVTGENNFYFDIGSQQFYTNQVLGEDGTYGSSIEYLYWWDTKGIYHQHYVQGGQIVHISDQPIAVRGIIINMELTQKK